MTEPDPHLLPDGSTSWGPDAEPEVPFSGAWEPVRSSVPEPTGAMVEAGAKCYHEGADDWSDALKAAIAAAPPEWLLRAALTEEELEALWGMVQGVNWIPVETAGRAARKIRKARALRGGEEPCPACGGRGWHTAGGNDPATCGRCGGGEET